MDKHIAACGLDCAECPAMIATAENDLAALARIAEDWGRQFGFAATAESVRCHGCHATDGLQIGHCSECTMRLCAVGRGHRTCAECADYACAGLRDFFGKAPGTKERLDALRASR